MASPPREIQWLFELPEGLTFSSEVEVASPTEGTSERFAGKDCQPPNQLP